MMLVVDEREKSWQLQVIELLHVIATRLERLELHQEAAVKTLARISGTQPGHPLSSS